MKGFAGLWWRADGKTPAIAFDNMQSRKIAGDTDWKEYDITLEIPEETVGIVFGALLAGSGKAWFDGLRVEIDGKPFDPAGRLDLGFEASELKDFRTGGARYAVVQDDATVKEGKKSLRMESKAGASKDLGPTAKACGDIVDRNVGHPQVLPVCRAANAGHPLTSQGEGGGRR